MKKVLKVIGILLLAVILLFMIFVLICFLMQKSAMKETREALTAKQLCNLVSAGEIELNVPVFGSENPSHTVVALPGSGDSAFVPAMKVFADFMPEDVQLAVVERPGYGLSDVGKEDMTVEYVVESSRAALKSAGIAQPYILMPHSLSGVYATWWVNTYPDEIEGVLFLDSVYDPDEEMQILPNFYDKLFNWMGTTGVYRMLATEDIMPMQATWLPPSQQDNAVTMYNYRLYNKSKMSELVLIDDSMQKAWDSIHETDMPKIYLYTDPNSIEDTKEMLRFSLGDEYDALTDAEIEEYDAARTDVNAEKRAEYAEKLGNCELVQIPASHFLYLHKPEETAQQLERLLDMIG